MPEDAAARARKPSQPRPATPVERTLTTIDAHQRLREVRLLVQDPAEAEFCLAVEQIMMRAVVPSTSGFDVRTDVATEIFQLATQATAAR